MIGFTYIMFVLVAAMIGIGIGYAGHFARSNLRSTPEQIFEGGIIADLANGALTHHNTYFEKHVIGAKWDDNGFWDADSNRNLVYYMISGFATPILIGIICWPERATFVGLTCKGLMQIGLHPPLC